MKELDFTKQIKDQLLAQQGTEEVISEETWAAEKNKGKKLNKPFRTPGGPKKFSVYVKNDKGNVVKVNFGDPNMSIKRDDPARRKSFRARHGCDNPGPKTKAKYWSCKMWSKKSVTKMTKGEDGTEQEMVEFLDESEARSGPKSAAQTPAKPSEKKKGSNKNKAGSAGEKGSKITFSEKVISGLKQKVSDHNKKNPSKKVTLGQLKKIYRRGAGAFSTSHRPGMTRGGWAMARVNMFLKMKRGGKVKDSYRKADQDVAKASSVYLEDDGDWGITQEERIEVDLDIKKFDLLDESQADFDGIFKEDIEAELSKEQKKLPPALQKVIMKKKGGKPDEKKDKESDKSKDKKESKKEDSKAAESQAKYIFDNPGEAMQAAKKLGLNGIHEQKQNGKTMFMPGKTHEELQKKIKQDSEAGHAPGHKKGLWENIRDKKKRMGKNYKPAKPGDKDRPSKEALEKAKRSSNK